jgi:hypothetical protein
MAKIEIEVQSTVRCVCGIELRQVSVTNNEGGIAGIVTTCTPCTFCQNEARVQAYNRGLEYGRKSQD